MTKKLQCDNRLSSHEGGSGCSYNNDGYCFKTRALCQAAGFTSIAFNPHKLVRCARLSLLHGWGNAVIESIWKIGAGFFKEVELEK